MRVKGILGFLIVISIVGCMNYPVTVNPPPETIPRNVTITVISEPSGARIYQEGIYKGTAPLTLNYTFRIISRPQPDGSILNSWEDDPYHYGFASNEKPTKPLTAVLDGYKPQTKQYSFKIDEVAQSDSFSILFALESESRAGQQQQQQQTVIIPTDVGARKNYGSLNISTTPPQAEIYIDGSFVATTPASSLQLEVGQHKIEIRKAGYKLWTRTLQVLPDSPVTIEIILEKT